MKIEFNFTKIFLFLLFFYTLFFVICGVLAPVLAVNKQFYLADIIYLLMHKSCTQEALRCFWICGYQMAICARCLGAYFGVIIAILLWLSNKIKFDKKIYFLLILIAFGEILFEFLKIYNGNNYIRFFAGISLGGFLIMSLFYLITYTRREKNNV